MRTAKNKKNRIVKIGVFLFFSFILLFLINESHKNITRTLDCFYKNIGIIDDFGTTMRFDRGQGHRSPDTRTYVFFVRIRDNNTIFSYARTAFNRNYDDLISRVNIGDSVKIYHEGFNERSSTVNIIQLEVNDNVIISKDSYDNKEIILMVWLILLIPIIFVITFASDIGTWLSRRKNKNIYKALKSHPRLRYRHS